MPARTLTFGRTDDDVPTQFDVFNPGPAQWTYLPNSRGTEARIGPVLLPSSTAPTAGAIQRAIARAPKAFQREAVDVISITTTGVLSVASLGREPVAALGIPARTVASMDFTPARKRRDATLNIRTPFAPSQEVDGDQTNGIPLLDVLGPRVLLWAPTHPELAFTVAVWHDPPPPYMPGGSSAVSPDQFHVGFQEALPKSTVPAGYTAYTVVLVDRGAFAVRIAPRPGAGDAWTTVDEISADAGQMQVTVPQAASQADALVSVFKRANANPNTRVKDIAFMTDNETVAERRWNMPFDQLYHRGEQEFELPPTPPESGINIFGEIEVLRLADARGVFTIGKEPLELKAKTPLELRQFSSRRDPRSRLLIPVRIDANSARFDVQGDADTRVNDEPFATSRPWIARALAPDIVTVICAAVTALFFATTGREFRKLRDI